MCSGMVEKEKRGRLSGSKLGVINAHNFSS